MNLRHPHAVASNGCGCLSLSLSLSLHLCLSRSLFCATLLCWTFRYLQVLCGQVSSWNAQIGHLLRGKEQGRWLSVTSLPAVLHETPMNQVIPLSVRFHVCVCMEMERMSLSTSRGPQRSQTSESISSHNLSSAASLPLFPLLSAIPSQPKV